MRVAEIFGGAYIEYPQDMADIEINEIVTDSRRVSEGSMFICIRGLHSDGHEYIGDAIKKGAKVIVAERVRDDGVGGAATIYVENTRRAAALLYNSWYKNPTRGMDLVAVTGTNGKTSVTCMLYKIFLDAGYRCGLIGTLECRSYRGKIASFSGDPLANMTTPDPSELYRVLSLMRDEGVGIVFLEATSHALALSKLDALRFNTAVFTNLTEDHLDFHGDMEGYFAAKSKLFDMCDRAVINIDDKWAERLIKDAKCPKIYTVSTNKNADFSAGNVREYGIYGSEYSVYQDGCEAIFRIGLIGDFFVSNSLMATAVALLFKIPLGSIRGTFASFPGIDGRMERVLLDGGAAVFIDYAHTPDALERALKALQSARRERGRIILVFGCGGDRDRQKRKEMAHIASRLADVIIITSDNSRSEAPEQIFSDILSGIDKEREYSLIEDRRAAIEYAIEISTAEDVILLAGKGHERYEIDKNGRHAFDERQIVKNAYEKHKR